MSESKPLSTPLSTATKLTKDGEPLDTTAYSYSQLIGSLMYLSVCTRPDIAQAVGALARCMAAPTTTHWQAAKGVLRYIAGTSDFGITYGGADLEAYCDADYAGDTPLNHRLCVHPGRRRHQLVKPPAAHSGSLHNGSRIYGSRLCHQGGCGCAPC